MQKKLMRSAGFAIAALALSTFPVAPNVVAQGSHEGAQEGLLAFSIISSARAAGSHSGGHGRKNGHGHGGGHGRENGHGNGGGHGSATSIGEPGKLTDATRIVEIRMTDNRFSHRRISVKKGETIVFVLRNRGEVVHEFNIGTAEMHLAHQSEMETMVEHGVLEVDRVNFSRMNMDMGGGKSMAHDGRSPLE